MKTTAVHIPSLKYMAVMGWWLPVWNELKLANEPISNWKSEFSYMFPKVILCVSQQLFSPCVCGDKPASLIQAHFLYEVITSCVSPPPGLSNRRGAQNPMTVVADD